jgi:hypothetical protein
MLIPSEEKHSLAFRNAPTWSGMVVTYVFFIPGYSPVNVHVQERSWRASGSHVFQREPGKGLFV